MIDLQKYGLLDTAQNARPFHIVTADLYDQWHATINPHQQAWVAAHNFTAKPGAAISLPNSDGTINLAVGIVGDHKVWDGAMLAAALPSGQWEMVVYQDCIDAAHCESLALGWGLSQYRFDQFRPAPSSQAPAAPPSQLACSGSMNLPRLAGVLGGIYTCRDLINMPPNHLTPAGLEAAARDLARVHEAKITVHADKDLADNFPAIHTVGRAAEVGPRLLDIRWGDTGPKITLIGKGVTFDSGGLDLKPSKGMELMKKDMGGAAIALGLAQALMTSGTKIQLRVLIAAAENAVSDRAMRPLDVIDTRAGIKVEVGNTDAEGRLVLADAITYAREDAPDFMIDFATLTGAARVALGAELPALFANNQATASTLLTASQRSADPLWQLPLFDDYERHLDAGYAALSSTGLSGYGGAITAALFLRRFAGRDSNWAHIDVMAWNLAARPGRPKGGEAMGLRAVFEYISTLV
jgi:leucyl aminopeptidase